MDAFFENTLEGHKAEVTPLWDCDFAWIATNLIRTAKEKVYITTYKMEPKSTPKAQNINRLITQLVAANNRGLDVRVLMNFQLNKKATSSINWYAAGALAKRNLNARHLQSGRILHAKIVIIDNALTIIGSHNWSVLSNDRNFELSVLIKSTEVVKKITEKFCYFWEKSTVFPVRKSTQT